MNNQEFFSESEAYVFGKKQVETFFDANGVMTQIASADVPQETIDHWSNNFSKLSSGNYEIPYLCECLQFTNLYRKRQKGEPLTVNDFLNDFTIMFNQVEGTLVSDQNKSTLFKAFISYSKCGYLPCCVKIQNFVDPEITKIRDFVTCEARGSLESFFTRPNSYAYVLDSFVVNHQDSITHKKIVTVYTIIKYASSSMKSILQSFVDPKILFSFYGQILFTISQMPKPYGEMYLSKLITRETPFHSKQFMLRHSSWEYTWYTFANTNIELKIPPLGNCEDLVEEKDYGPIVFTHWSQLDKYHINDFANLQAYGKDILCITHQFYDHVLKLANHEEYNALIGYFAKVLNFYMQALNNPNAFKDLKQLNIFIFQIFEDKFLGDRFGKEHDFYSEFGNSDY